MQIKTFEGGLNTRVAPNLIAPNQSVVQVNADTSSGVIKSFKGLGPGLQAISANATWYKAKSEWVSSTEERDYLEYQGKLYWTRDGAAQQYDGTSVQNMGIVKPNVAPTASANGLGSGGQDGTYQYVYSYYNDLTGIESSISPLSAEVLLEARSATISYSASTDPQVTHIRVYRIGGTWTDFLLIATVANVTGSYVDTLPDEDLQGRLLGNVSNEAPPLGVRYLTERQGTFFAAKGSLLHYTKGDGKPQYWPGENYFEFFEGITSLANVSEGLLVFTEHSTHLLVGNDPLSFTIVPIEQSLGSINHKATKAAKNGVIVQTHNGFYFATARGLEPLSLLSLSQTQFSVVNAVWLNDVYYAHLADGTTLVHDLRFTPTWYYLAVGASQITSNFKDLYYIDSGMLKKAFAGAPLTFSYKTGKLTDGSIATNKQYNKVYLFVNGTIEAKFYANGSLVHTESVTGETTFQLTPNHTLQRGYYFEVELTGVGEVLEIAFTPSTL